MADLQCPGLNASVAQGTAWDFASEATAGASQQAAQAKADVGAQAAATAQFASHQCPPPCISVPIVRFVKRGATLLTTPAEHPLSIALAYTVWELDVLCMDVTGAPPGVGAHGGGQSLPWPAPAGPPPLGPGDVIDEKWVVVDVACETQASQDTRTVGYTLTTVSCAGCGGECMVVRCPVAPLTPAENRWTLVAHSKGGGTFKRFEGQPEYYYKCVCLSD